MSPLCLRKRHQVEVQMRGGCCAYELAESIGRGFPAEAHSGLYAQKATDILVQCTNKGAYKYATTSVPHNANSKQKNEKTYQKKRVHYNITVKFH